MEEETRMKRIDSEGETLKESLFSDTPIVQSFKQKSKSVAQVFRSKKSSLFGDYNFENTVMEGNPTKTKNSIFEIKSCDIQRNIDSSVFGSKTNSHLKINENKPMNSKSFNLKSQKNSLNANEFLSCSNPKDSKILMERSSDINSLNISNHHVLKKLRTMCSQDDINIIVTLEDLKKRFQNEILKKNIALLLSEETDTKLKNLHKKVKEIQNENKELKNHTN